VPAETVSIPTVVEAGVQDKVRAEAEPEEEVEAMLALVVTEVGAEELTLEDEERDTRALFSEAKRGTSVAHKSVFE
jgi:hypothetical protein